MAITSESVACSLDAHQPARLLAINQLEMVRAQLTNGYARALINSMPA